MATTRKTRTGASTDEQAYDGFTAEERAAMKERAKELKAASRRTKSNGAAEDRQALLDKIAELTGPDRALADRVHRIITRTAPDLAPKLWYGMPAYARDGKYVCYFQPAAKFKARYATLGFNDPARLDDGTMWPTAYALTADLSPEDEEMIAALVRKAVG